jgi:L-alanine-DL-glutamate epimerase-like enolase superfamily enzyme
VKLDIERRTLRLEKPLQSAYGAIHERELVLVALSDEDGVVGYGEAAPLEAYDGVSIARVQDALERYAPVLATSEGMNGAQLIEACRAVEDLPQALAAIDLALWDRAGRRAGKPVAALLSDDAATHVPVNATLSALDRAGAAEQAAAAVREGYTCLKLKVGVGDDAGRVAATRAWRRRCARSRPSPPPGSSWSRSPRTACTPCARCASGWRCGSRSTRPRASTEH